MRSHGRNIGGPTDRRPTWPLHHQKLKEDIRADGGKATINTVEGEPLTFTEHDGRIRITDEKGDVAEITQGNVMQSNGVIQVINSVLMPS
ncbi:MAG: fasciclin domain-containing protein [Xanthobacteraceae bacterium]